MWTNLDNFNTELLAINSLGTTLSESAIVVSRRILARVGAETGVQTVLRFAKDLPHPVT